MDRLLLLKLIVLKDEYQKRVRSINESNLHFMEINKQLFNLRNELWNELEPIFENLFGEQ